MEVLEKVVFGGYTVQDLLIAFGALVAVFILIGVVKKLFGKKEPTPHVQLSTCKNCGWKGQISRYAGVCPKCNSPLGDRLAGSFKNK